jgi:hypothetical protein
LLLAFVPTEVTVLRQTTIIMVSITAYSTAVGPSSFRKKRSTRDTKDFAIESPHDGKARKTEGSKDIKA